MSFEPRPRCRCVKAGRNGLVRRNGMTLVRPDRFDRRKDLTRQGETVANQSGVDGVTTPARHKPPHGAPPHRRCAQHTGGTAMKKSVVTRLGSLALTTALVAAGAAATMTPADASRAAAKYRVTLQVSSNDVVADQDEVVLTGRVFPTPGPGSKVHVQLQFEGKDKLEVVGTAKVDKKGRFAYTDEPTLEPGPQLSRREAGRRQGCQGDQQGAGRRGLGLAVARRPDHQRRREHRQHLLDADQRRRLPPHPLPRQDQGHRLRRVDAGPQVHRAGGDLRPVRPHRDRRQGPDSRHERRHGVVRPGLQPR